MGSPSGAGRPRDPLRAARLHVKRGRFRRALEELAAVRGEGGAAPEWLLLSAMAAWRVGAFGESLGHAREALEGYRRTGDGDGEMRAENVAAAGRFALGDLQEARAGFERALRLARQRADTLMMARCANNLGNVAYYAGENQEALRHYRQAATLFEQVEFLHGQAEAWHNTGIVQREDGDLAGARLATDRAVEIAERLRDDRVMGWALGGRGETDAMLGDLQLGRVETERARGLASRREDPLTEVECLRVLAFIARRAGQVPDAVDSAREAVSQAVTAGNPWMIAKTQQELGWALVSGGTRDEAAEAFGAAVRALAAMGASTRADVVRRAMEEIGLPPPGRA